MTVTTSQIAERLQMSFTGVQPLQAIDANKIFQSVHARTVSVLSLLGLELVIGCYALTEDIEEGEYQRYLWIPQTKSAFIF